MYRTGPFVRSRALGLTPDLLLLGKGTSDMIFPFALTLYSDAVADRLAGSRADADRCDQAAFRLRAGVSDGRQPPPPRRTDRPDPTGRGGGRVVPPRARRGPGVLPDRARCPGLRPADRRRARHAAMAPAMAREATRGTLAGRPCSDIPRFPVLAGFCQYEPNVLKITPPLDARPDEILRGLPHDRRGAERPAPQGPRRRPRRPPQAVTDPEERKS